jgi:hypothetical protein
MKRLLLAVLLIAATAVWAEDLVEAAKAAKAKRKKSTTKVITNADVKKAKSKLIVNEHAATVAVEPVSNESSLEKQAREKRERSLADLKLAAAKATVAQFEKELAALEQKYYEENDLHRRDTELVRRFDETKAKLDAARKELEALLPPADDSQTPDP